MPILLCALEHEAACLRSALHATPGGDALAGAVHVSGPGDAAIERFVGALTDDDLRSGIILAGLAGGLRPGLATGSAFVITEVLDERAVPLRPSLPSRTPIPCRVVSAENVVGHPNDKRRWHARTGADLIDTESRAFAQAAEFRGAPWAIVRGVGDDAETALPSWIGSLVDDRGKTRLAQVAWQLLRHPAALPVLMRLQRDGAAALRAVATTLATTFGDPPAS